MYPSWLPTSVSAYNIPGYGILLVLIITLIKTWPIIQKNLLDARENRESRYGTRIHDLEEAVARCQEECEEHKTELRKEIRHLEEIMAGMRRQHVQEQLSLVSAIIESIDNPMLKQVLSRLQSIKHSFPVEQLGEVLGDAADDAN